MLVLIHLLMMICGSFTLGKLFEFISTYFWINKALYYSLTNWYFPGGGGVNARG